MTTAARRLLLFGALLSWCGVLFIFRWSRTGAIGFGFLPWNLFLAGVPAAAAYAFARSSRSASPIVVRWLWFGIWLLFLPNAPYLVTDFVHLAPQAAIPLWYDIALLSCAAGTGVLLAYVSVADVQRTIDERFGRAAGWGVAVTALILSAFGIYLGRFLRLNSWDLLSDPVVLFHGVRASALEPSEHDRTVGVTVIYGVTLALGYAAMRVIGAEARRERPSADVAE